MLKLDWIEALGDRNPQLLRELKGRLKPRNVILAVALSILGQFLLWVSFLMDIPHPTTYLAVYKEGFPKSNLYCTGSINYGHNRQCLVDAVGNVVVDWQKWSLDLFLVLSIIGIFGLIVGGTYLLIDNLAYEERQGTLNFIRLSPRSPQNILWGKILGVPILLYVVAILAVPLHLGTGIAAHIPLIQILLFYGVLVTSCGFFYSLSILFSLINSGELSRFQALFASGVVCLFIFVGVFKPIFSNSLDWIDVFSPDSILQHLIINTGINPTISFSDLGIQSLKWFNLPIGMSSVGIASILILNYSLWTYWSWQAIERLFLSPGKTIFSKRQSYLLVACFEVVALGFAVHSTKSGLVHQFFILLTYNFLLFFGLIITFTPQRQTVIDWTRYRKQKLSSGNGLLNSSLLRDLVWGEKSPVIIAIALNTVIVAIVLVPWIMLFSDDNDKFSVLIALVLSLSLIVVCAAIAQLVALMHSQKPGLWIIGTLGTVVILPPLIISLLSISSVQTPTLLLFTVFAFAAIKDAGIFNIFLALVAQSSLLTLCSWQITRQLKKAGTSNSSALFANQPRIKSISN